MIINYKIFEGFIQNKDKQILSFLKKYFKLTNFGIKTYYLYDVERIFSFTKDDIKRQKRYNIITKVRTSVYFFVENEYYIIKLNDKHIFTFLTLKDLEKSLTEIINIYYNDILNLKYINNIEYIPVFDTEKYSELIYKLISKNIDYLKQIKNIKKYLTKDYLDKIEILKNANNFDLI
jgi:hypothetical protein